MARAKTKNSEVVDLSRERERRRLRSYRARARSLLDANKRALTKLFTTGTLYTRHGARAGRELLGTYQHLLRVDEVLARLADLESVQGTMKGREARRLLTELDTLVKRSKLLSSHADDLLAWFGP
ncbi:MAG TPA: hypothetical protein VGK67_13145 [Myxococcales bacterium]|jgi:hypothetical protein